MWNLAQTEKVFCPFYAIFVIPHSEIRMAILIIPHFLHCVVCTQQGVVHILRNQQRGEGVSKCLRLITGGGGGGWPFIT